MDKLSSEVLSGSHDISVKDRREIYLTGIKKIISFDNEEFLMDSTLGTILLKGENLEILRLDTHDGNVRIKGKMNSFTYVENKEKVKEESFIAKLFK